MLYEMAHIVKNRFGFVWNAIESLNSFVFALLHRSALKRIPAILKDCSDKYELRPAGLADVEKLANFFADQPEEAFKFFKPHGFDEKSLTKIVKSKSFLTFLVLENGTIVGYFFLRCFANGKSFKGYMVDFRQCGKGIAKLEGVAMNRVNEILGIRMFGSISPENKASMACAKAVNELKILKTLENGDYYIEFLPKEVGEA